MSRLRSWTYALKNLFQSRQLDAELDEELRFHIDMETENNVASGMTRREARRRALIALGGTERTRESYRDAHGARFWREALSDCAYAARYLRNRKAFAASALAILGICIGANIAFFAALESIALRPLPFPDSDQLVEIYRSDRDASNAKLGSNLSLLSEYERQPELFQSVGYFVSNWMNIDARGETSRVNALRVSDGLFETLRLAPVAGSLIGPETPDRSAVLSDSLWETAFGRDLDALGSTIQLDGAPYTVIGVAPPAAEKLSNRAGVFLAIDQAELAADANDEQRRSANEGTVWARLKPGVTSTQARGSLIALEKRFAERSSQSYREINDTDRRPISVASVQREKTKWAKDRLLLLNATALLVLAIGSVNITNLLLAQANSRKHEFWTRRTVGATAGRLFRQCLTEVSLLALLGWIGGLIIGFYCSRLLGAYSESLFNLTETIEISYPTFLYSIGITGLCAIGLGSVLGWKCVSLTRESSSGRSPVQSTEDRSAVRLKGLLSIGQTAITLALLIGLGLLGKSFYNVLNQDLGFDGRGVVSGRIHLPRLTYDGDAKEGFKKQLLEKLNALPGVESTGAASMIPSYGYPDRSVASRSQPNGVSSSSRRVYFCNISPGYLETMGISLLEGRDFDAFDETGWQTPIIVDARFAEIHFPGKSPIGERMRLGGPPQNPTNWPVIVGVVETAKHTAIDEENTLPLVYLPLKGAWANEFSVFAKSRQNSNATLAAIRSTLRDIDPSLPLFRAGDMQTIISESLVARKGLLLLGLGLGIVAVGLAAIGVYGSVAFRVSQKLREFAIRLAIGASERQLILANVGQDLRHAALGVALGAVAALFLGRLMTRWLYRVDPFDTPTYLALSILLLSICGVASYLPSRRGIASHKLRL